jgi:poly-gamma-glutamate synthesis protein (capsule biosynthesis protein)
MQAAIADLRRNADVIVVSHHWGRAGLPAILTDYERILGHASIDAGADIVLGHHHHFLRGIELYRGKPIFYGLGHFVFDLPGLENALTEDEIQKLNEMGEYAIYPRDGYPLSPFHPDARMTMIATCDFTGKELRSVGFVPCLLNGAKQRYSAAHRVYRNGPHCRLHARDHYHCEPAHKICRCWSASGSILPVPGCDLNEHLS